MITSKKTLSTKYIITYLLIAFNIAIFATLELSGSSSTNTLDLLKWGANFYPYTFKNEWWRLITSAFLHIGLFHLIANMYSLYIIGRDIENQIGSFFFFSLYLISGIAAGLASGFYNLYIVSAGASGAIFGIYGFDIVSVIISHRHDTAKIRNVIINFILYLVFITIIGISANFDNAAHFGGLIAGFIIALVYFTVKAGRSFLKLMIVSVTGVFLCYYAYTILPRDKVAYFDAFQSFLELDESTIEAMNKRYDNDSLMAHQLESFGKEWLRFESTLDSIEHLPVALASDTSILKEFSRLKRQELAYIVTSIRQESYIYFDSLGVVKSMFSQLPKLEHSLNIKPTATPADSNKNEAISPMEVQYYDSLWRPIAQPPYAYVREGRKDSLGRWEGWVFDYYKDGQIQMKGQYDRDLRDGIFIYYDDNNTYSASGRYDKERKVGKWQYFYKNGSLNSEVRYADWAYTINTWDTTGNIMVKNGNGIDLHKYGNGVVASFIEFREGQPVGASFGNHKNGEPYFYEVHENGRLTYGKSMDLDGNKSEYDITAYFTIPEGGWESFNKYLETNKQYPEQAKSKGIEGELEVVLTVYAHGEIGEVRFLNELGYGCEQEAERLLLNGPKWKPPLQYGLKPMTSDVRVVMSFP